SKPQSSPDVIQLAALPAPVLPRVGTSFLSFPRLVSAEGSRRPDESLAVLGIPWAYATLKDVSIRPGSRAGRPLVLILQDVHGSPEAQANIARIIESAKPATVALEGADGVLDFSSLRSL